MFYVYILLSKKDSKFYIGSSANLKRRITEHESGQVDSTKGRRPLTLVMYEAYQLEEDARARELFFKTTKGKAQLRKQLKTFLSRLQAGMAQFRQTCLPAGRGG